MDKDTFKDNYHTVAKFAGFFLLVALIVTAAFWAFRQSQVAAEAQKSTHALIMRADALLSELKDAETGERGYLLLGDERYLEPYLLVVDKVGSHLQELQQLTLDIAARKHLEALTPLVKARMAEMASLIDLRRSHDITAVTMAISSNQGKRLMDLIRAEISRYIQLQEDALTRHNADFRTNMQLMFATIVTASVLMLFFLITLAISDRKRLQMEREKAFDSFRKIASQIPGMVFQFHLRSDGSSCFPYASEGIREIYRLSPENVREDASNVFALLHPDDFDGINTSIQTSKRDLTPWHHEYRVKFGDGTVRWLLGNALIQSETDDSTLWYGFITDITARKQLETAVKDNQEFAENIVETLHEPLIILDWDLKIIKANPSFYRTFKVTPEDTIGHFIYDLGNRQWDIPKLRALLEDILPNESVFNDYEVEHNFPDVGQKIILLNAREIFRGKIGSHIILLAFEDITERKQAEEKLRLAASVFSHAWEGIMITEADGTIVDVNEAFSRITSYSRDEVQNQNPRILSSGLQGRDFYASLWADLIGKGHWYGEIWNRRKNGEVYAVMQTIGAVRDDQNNTRHYVAMFSDITLLKKHEKELEHIAHYDVLTNLPNRLLLDDRLRQAMVQAKRHSNQLAVVFFDLDGFKGINDRHGHEAGDQVLMAVANRLKLTLREGDTLARLGGDEFIAVLHDLADEDASEPILTRMLAAAAEPMQFGDMTLQVSASMGVSFYSQAYDIAADQLLRQADQAMYQAKQAGKNRYHFFDALQDDIVLGQHETVKRIRQALSAGEFVLYYQPKVNMRLGTVIGAEALIRWQHPEKGLLLPVVFLPVIENHPLAVDIGEWVINTAMAQIESWKIAGLNIPISVNIGARQLQQTNFVERLCEMLAAHPTVRQGDLEMEVLETSAMEDLTKVSQIIDASRKVGVSFALDDFGTGYSSLTYLKRLPVSQIKIDQSFVQGMLDDPDDRAILEGVLGLATAFRLQVIAEGVETIEHGTLLLQLGCDLAQGYGIARPMPPDLLPGWSATWQSDPVWMGLPSFSRDDLPLLFASIELRAWIFALEKYLNGDYETAQPLNNHQCRFGQWLDTEGLARYGKKPAFAVIGRLHQQAHELASELCKLHNQGNNLEAALARLEEFHFLRDALLEQLKALVQVGRRKEEVA